MSAIVNRPVRTDRTLKSMPHMRHRGLLALKCGLTIGILFYIITVIPGDQVIQFVNTARAWYVIMAFVIVVPAVYVSACRLKILTDTQGMSLSFSRIAQINFITYFYGLLLPGYLPASAVRWYKFSQLDDKRVDALAAIAFSRLHFMIFVVVLGIVFSMLDQSHAQQNVVTFSLLALLFCLCAMHFVG